MAIECNSKPNRREIWISFGPTLWSPSSQNQLIALASLAYFLFFNSISSFFQFPNFVCTSSFSTVFNLFSIGKFCVSYFPTFFYFFNFVISSPSSSSILLVVPSCPDVHVRNFHPHTLKCLFLLHFGKNSGVFRGWHEFGNEKIIIISIR